MSTGEKYYVIGACSGQCFYYGKSKGLDLLSIFAAKPVYYEGREYHLLEVECDHDDDVSVTLKDVVSKKKKSFDLKGYTWTKCGQLGNRRVYNKPLIDAVYKALGRNRVRAIKEEWKEMGL